MIIASEFTINYIIQFFNDTNKMYKAKHNTSTKHSDLTQ